ncbi:hypothetical protein [Ectobacillus panaciterrae]|uniref:hypothetical protein n=1 Tax=Ectobacillus panaciterrae TaxID=363872 RepID=UPI0004135FAE|nr:hypothetical protein [Ectobacillus panaciterrae]
MKQERDIVGNVHLKTADISHITGLAESTVRKYSLELEKQGYEFFKDGDTRLYTSNDVTVFNQVKEIRDKTKVSLSHAVAVIMTQRAYATQSVAAEEVAVSKVSDEEERHVIQGMAVAMKEHIEDIKQGIASEFINLREELQAERDKNKELEQKLDLVIEHLERLTGKVEEASKEQKRKKFLGLF